MRALINHSPAKIRVPPLKNAGPIRPRQISFITAQPSYHGGDHLKGKRKQARPIALRTPMHIVMRASRAQGAWSLLRPKNAAAIRALTERLAKKYGIALDQYANVGNHLHLLTRTRSRRLFQRFLKELPGAIAMGITGARKGSEQKFWDARVFTRVVTWGRDLRNLEFYFIKNLFEASGLHSKKAMAEGLRVIPLFGMLAEGVPRKA